MPLARALVAGGVRVLEVTLRTPVALACIEAIAREVPEAIVGAGTIRTAADVRAARDAGSQFGVSPGYTAAIGAACRDAGLPLLPGVATASEVMAATADGLGFLKFFPATAAGGIPHAEGAGRAVPGCRVLPHRRHHRRDRTAVPGAAQRQGLRRLVADAGRRGGSRRLGAASRNWRAGQRAYAELPRTSAAIGCAPSASGDARRDRRARGSG